MVTNQPSYRSKTFKTAKTLDGAGAKYGTMVASAWQPMACVWFYSAVATWWHHGVVCAIRWQSVGKHYDNYDVFWRKVRQTPLAIGQYCDQTTQFEAGQPIRLMEWDGRADIWWGAWAGRCAVCTRPISPLRGGGWGLFDFSFGFRRPTHYSCSIVWQMSLPILMI